MARRSPGRVQMKCSTTGSGPYQLQDPSPALTGKRTIAHAVADGSLVNGDEILYAIVDPLAAGTARQLEVGRGTINTATLVLTVVQVYEKSALLASGGWGTGTRDVLISPPGAWNTAFIDLANVFTATQTIDGVVPILQFTSSSVIRLREVYSSNTGFRQYFNSSGVIRASQDLSDTLAYLSHYNSSGVLDGSLEVGAAALNFTESGVSKKVVRFVGGGVVKMTFNSAPPLGWTRINVTGERLGKYATASDTPEAQSGSWTLSGLTTPASGTDNYTLTITDIPSHTHKVGSNLNFLNGTGTALQAIQATATINDSGSTGGGGAHSHGISAMTIASAGTWRPPFEIVVKASFD